MRPTVEVPSGLLKRAMLLLQINGDQNGERVNNSTKTAADLRPYVEIGNMPLYHFEGRRWFQKSMGNTYHTVRIYENGELIYTSDRYYGYDEQYLQTGLAWLKNQKRIDVKVDTVCSTLYIRETLRSTYIVTDVKREKDL